MDFRQLVNKLPPNASFTILSDSCHSGGLIAQEKEQIGPFTIESKAQAQSSRPRHIPYEKILQKLKQSTSIDTLSFFIKEVDNQEQLGCLERAMKSACGILLSGCQSNETSADVNMEADKGGKAHGAFSYAIEQVLMQNLGQLSNKEVVMKAREVLLEQGYKQHPGLYCSNENANAIFLMQP